MLSDTLSVGTTPVTYIRRTPKGNRSQFVPAGDTPANERRLEFAHEVTAARRVNSLQKVSLTRPHPVTGVLEEISLNLTSKRPASCTEAEYQLLVNHMFVMNTTTLVAFHTKLYNQES